MTAFVASAITITLSACAHRLDEIKPPAIIPISLNKSGAVLNQKILIVDHNVYYFTLRFSFTEKDQVDRARVANLVGGHELDKRGNVIRPGIPTPVKLSIYKVNGNKEIEIFTRQIDPVLTSWGGDSLKKQIGFSELRPGHYVVRLNLLRSAPEFDQTPINLGIGYDKFKLKFESDN